MIGTPKASVLLVSLATLLCLVALPILPERETASAKLSTAEVENTGTLLGENSPELGAPRKLLVFPPAGGTSRGPSRSPFPGSA